MTPLVRSLALAGMAAALACQRPPAPAARRGAPAVREAAHALGPDTTFSNQASFVRSRDTSGGGHYHLVNRRYLLPEVSPDRPLILETVDVRCCFEAEKSSWSRISLEGWPSAAAARGAPAWKTSIPADAGELWSDYYVATLYGCCDAADELTYVELRTGQTRFVASGPSGERRIGLPHLSVPNSFPRVERYAAFQDSYTEDRLPEARSDTTVVGALQYGSGREPPARQVLRTTGGDNFRLDSLYFEVPGDTTQRRDDVDLWRANGKSSPSLLSGFNVVVRLVNTQEDSAVTIRIPVSGDRLVTGGPGIPRGWTLRPR